MIVSQHAGCQRCPMRIGRRRFLATAGASALALKTGLFDCAASLLADEIPPPRKPIVRVAGSGHATDTIALHDRDDMTAFAATTHAAEKAYKMAGCGPTDLDMV